MNKSRWITVAVIGLGCTYLLYDPDPTVADISSNEMQIDSYCQPRIGKGIYLAENFPHRFWEAQLSAVRLLITETWSRMDSDPSAVSAESQAAFDKMHQIIESGNENLFGSMEEMISDRHKDDDDLRRAEMIILDARREEMAIAKTIRELEDRKTKLIINAVIMADLIRYERCERLIKEKLAAL